MQDVAQKETLGVTHFVSSAPHVNDSGLVVGRPSEEHGSLADVHYQRHASRVRNGKIRGRSRARALSCAKQQGESGEAKEAAGGGIPHLA